MQGRKGRAQETPLSSSRKVRFFVRSFKTYRTDSEMDEWRSSLHFSLKVLRDAEASKMPPPATPLIAELSHAMSQSSALFWKKVASSNRM